MFYKNYTVVIFSSCLMPVKVFVAYLSCFMNSQSPANFSFRCAAANGEMEKYVYLCETGIEL